MLRAILAATSLLLMDSGTVLAEAKAEARCEPTADGSRDLVVSFYTKALVEKRALDAGRGRELDALSKELHRRCPGGASLDSTSQACATQ